MEKSSCDLREQEFLIKQLKEEVDNKTIKIANLN